ncbi:hypothetical protein M9435_000850 [Picochlorum sp. BPE23]|nr:hypothetical protein M9435_000850 [Picochlorum sp. BPE23]
MMNQFPEKADYVESLDSQQSEWEATRTSDQAGQKFAHGSFPHGYSNKCDDFYTICPESRPLKRKRPVVRKNLQTLFDAAVPAHGASVGNDTTGSLGAGSGSSTLTDTDFWNSSGGDSTMWTSSQGTEESSAVKSDAQDPIIPLSDLLESERGHGITLLEIKAMLYSVAEDLLEMHAGNSVHQKMNLQSVVLQIADGAARASIQAGQDNAKEIALLGKAFPIRKGAKREIDGFCPPENVYCSENALVVTDKGNMWSFGCILFSLLSGGEMPFGELGVGICGGQTMFSSVDRQQEWMDSHLESKMRDVNRVAREHGPSDGVHSKNTQFKVLGFDNAAMSLIEDLLRVDPAQRPSAEVVLNHIWFEGIRDCIPHSCRSPDAVSETVEEPLPEEEKHWPLDNYEYSSERHAYVYIDPSLLSPLHPYPIVGRVEKETTFVSHEQLFVGTATYAVYDVPGQGTMMSAKPISIRPN